MIYFLDMIKTNILTILMCGGFFCSPPLHAVTIINNHVQVGPSRNPITIVPKKTGFAEGFAEGFSKTFPNAFEKALEKQRAASNVSDTKQAALISWIGGKQKICKACYESNLELKQRVEATTFLALELQSIGYGLEDSIEGAKTSVMTDMGSCYIPSCENSLLARNHRN